MARRSLILLGVISVTVLASCGPRSQTGQTTTFVTERPKGETPPPEAPPADGEIEDQETAAPLMIKDERKAEIPPYKMPATVRERLLKEIPDYVPPQSGEFQVENPHLNISSKNSTMTFTGTLKIKNRADEEFELACKFDKSKLWTCSNMFPVKESIAKERRLQATVNCADSYRCDNVGLELFVRMGDKTESQLFQTTKFEMRRATSGDIADYEHPEQETKRPDGIKVYEKPKPRPEDTNVLSEDDLNEIVDDSNIAIEIVAPMPVPAPTVGDFSIPGIEKLRPEIGAGVKNQAIGAHYDGRLENAAHLEKQGAGYRVRNGADRAFGTDLMISLIKGAAASVDTAKPGQSPIIVADIAKQYGGKLSNRSGRFHASHQTGLDADIVFPAHTAVDDMWAACSGSGARCRSGAKISSNLDDERFWLFLTSMTCADKNPVIALFLDTEIKKHMCQWARGRFGSELNDSSSCAFRTLRAMKYSEGHYNHVHVRLRCPGNRDCRDATVSLGKGTGC